MVLTRRHTTDQNNTILESGMPTVEAEMDLGPNQQSQQAMDATFPPPGATPEVPNPQANSPEWCSKVSDDISLLFKSVETMKQEILDLKMTPYMNFENTGDTKPGNDELCRLKRENDELRAEINELKRKCINLESQSRRENLLFDGVTESDKETWQTLREKFETFLPKLMSLTTGILNLREYIDWGKGRQTDQGQSL
jgi:hypothetical protein